MPTTVINILNGAGTVTATQSARQQQIIERYQNICPVLARHWVGHPATLMKVDKQRIVQSSGFSDLPFTFHPSHLEALLSSKELPSE